MTSGRRAQHFSRWRLLRCICACTTVLFAFACEVDTGGELPVIDVGQDLDPSQIPICGQMTLGEVLTADDLDDDCRERLESYLPEPSNTAEGRLLALGSSSDDDGVRRIYLQGIDADGAVITSAALAEATVSVVIDGETQAVDSAEIEIGAVADIGGDLFSLAIVNDYSASMGDDDLNTVETIEIDLLDYLPRVYEAEVTFFSTEVEVKQPFTTDQSLLLGAVARDDDYDRDSTALFDGMGTGLDSLITRERPVRLLIVSTDGAENASMTYTEAQILSVVESEDVFVIMIGAFLADVETMQRLAGDRGVFVYARDYARLRTSIDALLESFGEVVELQLPSTYADATSITVEAAGVTVIVTL